jgi:hypothetical protein
VLLAIGIIVFINGGMAVGLAAFVPVAVLLAGAAGACRNWYRAL